MSRMAWFTKGEPVNPTADEIRELWDDEAPAPGRGGGVLTLVGAVQVPGKSVVFTGWVVAGRFRKGQGVLLNGRSGFARGVIGDLGQDDSMPSEVTARSFVSMQVRHISTRLEILGLQAGCTITSA